MPQNENTGPIVAFHGRPGAIEEDAAARKDAIMRQSADDCRARERAERAAAKAATTLAARRAHQELASLYARLVRRSDRTG